MELEIYLIFYGVLIACLIADIVTTVQCLLKGFQETNPYAIWFVEKFGIKRGMFMVWLIWAALFFWLTWPFVVFAGVWAYSVFGIMAYKAFRHLHAAIHNHRVRMENMPG